MTSGPSQAGIAELKLAAAQLRPYEPPRRRHWPRWLTGKRIAIFLVADLVLGSIGWHYLTQSHPGAIAAAVQGTANDAAHNNWTGVYDRLCSSDRAQIQESDLASAGRAAILQLGELRSVTVTKVQPVTLRAGPIHWPAAEVSGKLVPVIGTPSAYTVTVVREAGGWRTCLSAGGYSSSALDVSAPLGSASLSLAGGAL